MAKWEKFHKHLSELPSTGTLQFIISQSLFLIFLCNTLYDYESRILVIKYLKKSMLRINLNFFAGKFEIRKVLDSDYFFA